jgi:hypothetical protein
MLVIAIFFVVGVVLGLIGLHLLRMWEGQPLFHQHRDARHGH